MVIKKTELRTARVKRGTDRIVFLGAQKQLNPNLRRGQKVIPGGGCALGPDGQFLIAGDNDVAAAVLARAVLARLLTKSSTINPRSQSPTSLEVWNVLCRDSHLSSDT